MLRRMKFKAAPNIFGGGKKPVQIQKTIKTENTIKVDKKEDNANLHDDIVEICSSSVLTDRLNDTNKQTSEVASNFALDNVETLHNNEKYKNSEDISMKASHLENDLKSGKSVATPEIFKRIESISRKEAQESSTSLNVNTDTNESGGSLITMEPKEPTLSENIVGDNKPDDKTCNERSLNSSQSKDTVHSINIPIPTSDVDLETNMEHSTSIQSESETNQVNSSPKKISKAKKPPINSATLLKNLTNRRTRIKGQPTLPSTKRPAINSLTQNENIESTRDSFKNILETIDNTESVSQSTIEKNELSKDETPVTSSHLIPKKGIESKENISNIEKVKEVESDHRHNSSKSLRLESKNKLIEKKEIPKSKKLYIERKQNFKKKTSSGNLEKNQMTMFDLIFWNPSKNPMPEQQRDRSDSINESFTMESMEEQSVEESGLEEASVKSSGEGKTSPQTNLDDSEEESSTLAPQVKIGPDGRLIIDEKSLVIKTTAAKNRDEVLSRTEVVEEGTESSHYGKWSKRRKRSTEWTRKETARFYKALSTVGTDFSLMETIFAWRSRAELKIKFKKEERVNRHLIDTALNDCTQFDFSIFEESEYDPEEDRKKSKEAEKEEAKRRKRLEREQRRLLKLKEKKLKKEQEKVDKLRRRKLKKLYKKQKKKKGNEASKALRNKTKPKEKKSLNIETQEVICEVVFSASEEDIVVENNFTKEEGVGGDKGRYPTKRKDHPGGREMHSTQCVNDEEVCARVSEAKISSCEVSMDFSTVPEVVEISEEDKISIATSESKLPVVEGPDFLSKEGSDQNSINDYVNERKGNLSMPLKSSSEIAFSDGNGEGLSCASRTGFISPVQDGCSSSQPEYHSLLEGSQCSGRPDDKQLEIAAGTGEPSIKESTDKEIGIELDSSDCNVQYVCPIASVQKSDSGQQFIELSTRKGIQKVVVPPYGPQTTNIVVMATTDPSNPSEHIYHVYTVAPINKESQPPEGVNSDHSADVRNRSPIPEVS